MYTLKQSLFSVSFSLDPQICDGDNDGILNDQELNDFQVPCIPHNNILGQGFFLYHTILGSDLKCHMLLRGQVY